MAETEKRTEAGEGNGGKKGKVVARNRDGKLHLRDVRSDGWSEEERTRFLEMLAATCNVDTSAAAAGHSSQSAKGLRLRDIEFRGQWDEALETGYAILETMLLEKAQNAVRAKPPRFNDAGVNATDAVADDISIKDIIALLDKHRSMVTRIRQGKAPRYAQKAATAKQCCAEIIQRMRALKKRLDAGE